MSEADKINSGYLTDVHGSLTIDTGAPPEGGFRITASSYVPDPIFIITSEGRWMCKGVDITDDAAALQAEPQPALFRDLLTVAEGLHAWCKAVPEDAVLPAMPGLDGDFIRQTLEAARTAALTKGQP